MKKIFHGLVLSTLFFSFSTAFADTKGDSVYQLVTFLWNGEEQKLEFIGTRSGPSINTDTARLGGDSDGIITNKHVVGHNGEVVDFVLLCPGVGNSKTYQTIECSVPAAVTAVHPELDVAIVKPLNDDHFLIPVPVAQYENNFGDSVRLMGFPTEIEGLTGSITI